jgi:predicted RNA-binding protein with PUA-like domain
MEMLRLPGGSSIFRICGARDVEWPSVGPKFSSVGVFVASDYLLKTEPTVYSFADLQRDKATEWDGVTNPTAVRNLREMKAGDGLIIYHTGDEKSAVGTATVVSVDASNPKGPVVTIKAGKALAKPVTLAEIKANKLFGDSPLVRQGRLSVVPLTASQFKALTKS